MTDLPDGCVRVRRRNGQAEQRDSTRRNQEQKRGASPLSRQELCHFLFPLRQQSACFSRSDNIADRLFPDELVVLSRRQAAALDEKRSEEKDTQPGNAVEDTDGHEPAGDEHTRPASKLDFSRAGIKKAYRSCKFSIKIANAALPSCWRWAGVPRTYLLETGDYKELHQCFHTRGLRLL